MTGRRVKLAPMNRRRGGPSWVLAVLAVAWFLAGHASADCVPAPELASYNFAARPADPTEAVAAGPTRSDRQGRIVAPVTVNGRGPFRFIVDTGANRSAIAERLAVELGLQPTGEGEVHNVYGVTEAPLITVDRLQYGDISLRGDVMPLLHGEVLAGEHGLLGVDGMAGRRLRIDFERNCIEIAPSRTARALSSWSELRGEMRFGHLVIIEGVIVGVRSKVFLDTGSDATLANVALNEAIAARVGRNLSREENITAFSAGRPVVLDRALLIPRMSLGSIEVRNITAYVGDFHIFDMWQLSTEPTLLVGMDVLSQSGALAIDYGRARVYIRPRADAEARRRATVRLAH